MQQFLERFSKFETSETPVLSVYLNTEPNKNGKRDFDSFLRKQISEHRGNYEADTADLQNFDAATAKIDEFIIALEPTTRGVAIFVAADEAFEKFEFEVPFEEDDFSVSEKPHIYPLVRLLEKHPTFAVVAADTNSANIYVFKRGKTVEKEEIQGTKTNRSEVGGWSQMRYQRHIENFHQQHAKEVIAELETLVRNDNIKHIVLVGDQAVIIPLLRAELSKELEAKVIDVLSLNVNTPEHEVLEAAEAAFRQNDELADKEKIDYLFEQNYGNGIGVVGFGKTLTALLNGQVQELYVSSDLNQITYNKGEVAKVLKDYAPGEDGDLPNAKHHAILVDELLKRAAETADDIRFIEDPDLLKEAGGVGAILRYQAKGVTNL